MKTPLSAILALASLVMVHTSRVDAALISEYQPNQAGVNSLTLTGEISGDANTAFTGFLLAIGGEPGRRGRVDNAAQIMGTFNPSGILSFSYDVFLDPTITIALVDDFRGQAGVTDIDLDDDGVADNVGDLIGIQDAIGVTDSLADQPFLYGRQLQTSVGQDFSFTGDEPRLIFRDRSVGDWYAINNPDGGQVFDINGQIVLQDFDDDPFANVNNTGLNSPGAINPGVTAVPEPGTFLAMGLIAVGGALRKRSRDRKTSDASA